MVNPDGNTPASPGGAGIAGAIIEVGAGLYDSHQNRKASKENTNKTIAAQKAEAELAYQRSIQQWNAQNMYNSPEAQMARFQAAGLNPHLIYGQGSSGLASSPPQYQPANLQYRYQAPSYGASIQSILPTLMAVGSWMQNMRSSEANIKKTTTETDRSQQLIDFLLQKNPRALEQMDNQMSLYPYQYNMQRTAADQARQKLFESEQDFRYKYGEGLFDQMGSAFQPQSGQYNSIGGTKRLSFLQEQSKQKLLEAKSSWSDFNITDPQAIMQLVMSGVLGLAGQSLRLAKPRPKVTNTTTERLRNGRTKTRIYQREH